MTEPAGIERAIFAGAPVDDWLDRLCLSRLHTPLSEVMFRSGRLSAVYGLGLADGREIAVLAGFAAGAHTEGSTTGTVAPSPAEVAAFLADYAAVRPLSAAEHSMAVAAAAWVLAYNARCGVGFPARDGSPLAMLDEYRDAYLAVSG